MLPSLKARANQGPQTYKKVGTELPPANKGDEGRERSCPAPEHGVSDLVSGAA